MIWLDGAAPTGRKRTLLRRKTLIQPCFEGLHMCMYLYVWVCICMYMYVSYVLYVLVCIVCMCMYVTSR